MCQDQSWRTSTDAVLGLSKPVWLWDHCGSQERDKKVPTCDRDADGTYAWLATTFFFGAQATSPYPPCGDHTTTSTNIAPGSLQVYRDFAPLWPLLQHKTWVLVPHAVEVNGKSLLCLIAVHNYIRPLSSSTAFVWVLIDSSISAANIFTLTSSREGLVVPVVNAYRFAQEAEHPLVAWRPGQ